MPIKFIENHSELDLIEPELKAQFIENKVSFHVCKDTHGNEQCYQCNRVSQEFDHPTFYVIYINKDLYQRIFQIFTHLIIDHPLHEDEDEDDLDGNSHVGTIFMCPYCGSSFGSQH